MYIFLTILQAIIIIVGLGFLLAFFIPGIAGDKKKLKKAGLIFIGTWLLLLLISGVEFIIALNK
jgi:Ca2+/Na+ antiporter